MVLLHEEDNHNHKDKRRNKALRTDTCQNLKRHIPLVSSELWQSLVAVCCVV